MAVWNRETIAELFEHMHELLAPYPAPMVMRLVAELDDDPYLVLISCLLSLRSRDIVTYDVVKKVWLRASTPEAMVKLSRNELEALIKPVGFFRRKAAVLQEVSQALLDRDGGRVPGTEAELLALPGVGRKTANLVLAEAFGIPAICVDTHVHRIANHLGLVVTKTVDETERALQKIVPRERWREINRLFVAWGQHICTVHTKPCACRHYLTEWFGAVPTT